MQPFVYTALPAKVIFGFGTLARVADEIRELGCRQALILSTPHQQAEARALAKQLGELSEKLDRVEAERREDSDEHDGGTHKL